MDYKSKDFQQIEHGTIAIPQKKYAVIESINSRILENVGKKVNVHILAFFNIGQGQFG